MQDHKRRKPTFRLSQRKRDFSNLLNRMIGDNNDFAIRQSLNPIVQEHLFPLLTYDKKMSKDALTALLKLVEKEILIIGFILPKKLLAKYWEMLSGSRQSKFIQNNLSCAVLSKHMLENTNNLLLMIDQSEINLERKLQIQQKIVVNLSFVLVTTTKIVEKRLQQWQVQQNLFDKHEGLLIIKQDGSHFNDSLVQKIQTKFWTFDTLKINQFQNRYKGIKQNNLMVPQRHAYQPMQQEQQEYTGFLAKLNALALISLKRNWKFSKGLMCFPFLYLLNIWLSSQPKDKLNEMVQNSIISYCSSLKQEFRKYLQNFKEPLDELKLRNSIETQKKTLLIAARKHLNMFQNIFPNFELTSTSHEGLDKFFCEAAKDRYQFNNNRATQKNLALLQNLYFQIIFKKFETNQPKPIEQFQNDFHRLLEVYGSQSLRVSSQLKTFNDFFKQKKHQYIQNLARELQNSKKKYYSQKEELKDRLDIQTGALQTLYNQLSQLEEKRRKIDLQNSLLKEKIYDCSKKNAIQTGTEYNKSSRKKYFEMTDRRAAKSSAKQLNTSKQISKKGKKCCCEIM